jgi:hypothetical protein
MIVELSVDDVWFLLQVLRGVVEISKIITTQACPVVAEKNAILVNKIDKIFLKLSLISLYELLEIFENKHGVVNVH